MKPWVQMAGCWGVLLYSALSGWAETTAWMECDPKLPPVSCYRAVLEKSIRKQWLPKAIAESKQATVRFVLNREGQLVGLRMKQGSGVPALDESIEEAVIAAAPFHPFPKQLKGEEAAFEFIFDYVPQTGKQP